MQQYLTDIEKMVEEGKLSEEKEFYAPIGFGGGKRVTDLAKSGIRYIELRNIDFKRLRTCRDQSSTSSVFTIVLNVYAMDGT